MACLSCWSQSEYKSVLTSVPVCMICYVQRWFVFYVQYIVTRINSINIHVDGMAERLLLYSQVRPLLPEPLKTPVFSPETWRRYVSPPSKPMSQHAVAWWQMHYVPFITKAMFTAHVAEQFNLFVSVIDMGLHIQIFSSSALTVIPLRSCGEGLLCEVLDNSFLPGPVFPE